MSRVDSRQESQDSGDRSRECKCKCKRSFHLGILASLLTSASHSLLFSSSRFFSLLGYPLLLRVRLDPGSLWFVVSGLGVCVFPFPGPFLGFLVVGFCGFRPEVFLTGLWVLFSGETQVKLVNCINDMSMGKEGKSRSVSWREQSEPSPSHCTPISHNISLFLLQAMGTAPLSPATVGDRKSGA